MAKSEELWDITNRPSTKTKLEILKKVFDIWLTIWNNQKWISDEWYIIDLFAGRGKYIDGGDDVNGSPLIFLKKISDKIERLRSDVKIRLFLVEKDTRNFKKLNKNVESVIKSNPFLADKIDVKFYNDDCNNAMEDIVSQIKNDRKHPLFILIDPTGLQIKKNTMEKIVSLRNPKDIMFNYILEGVRRTAGVAKKKLRGEKLSIREIKTIGTLQEFIGRDIEVINKSDRDTLENYCSVFTSQDLKVVAYDVQYPDRNDILYYLLFVSKKLTITKIVEDIYAKQKELISGPTLFGGKEFYKKQILTFPPPIQTIKRKTLLYETKVEYGNWTINHIVGCKHGCRFPCYAMMMAKKFGWVKDYEDWRKPRIVENALELLQKEISKYKNKINFVHLCFMSDPFMYDIERQNLVPEIKEMTLKIIEILNREGIKVTTLTKGIYPDEIFDTKKFSPKNEYGITLVSLNDEFKKKFEPFSAPYKARIDSLKKLSDMGLRTWVSMEPYPTPWLDKQAENIRDILEKISFVDKIIFGRLNYRKLTKHNTNHSKMWKNNDDFYKAMAQEVISFCKENNKRYHIKLGTPLSESKTTNIFED